MELTYPMGARKATGVSITRQDLLQELQEVSSLQASQAKGQHQRCTG